MIPAHMQQARDVKSQGAVASSRFHLDMDQAAHLMSILREGLYSDPILAVIREYGTNAWDSHKTSGCPDKPINVTLPTDFDPTYTVRDYGSGLSDDEVLRVFTGYGTSTKRDSNAAVGMLGIGRS